MHVALSYPVTSTVGQCYGVPVAAETHTINSMLLQHLTDVARRPTSPDQMRGTYKFRASRLAVFGESMDLQGRVANQKYDFSNGSGKEQQPLNGEIAHLSPEQIVAEYGPLVKRIAHHLAHKVPDHVGVEDLIQVGMVRLLEASADYDPSRGASFGTYAGIRLRGAMMDEIRSNTWAPRSVAKKSREIDAAFRKLSTDLSRLPTHREMQEELGMDPKEYHAALANAEKIKLLSVEDIFGRESGEPAKYDPRAQLPEDIIEAEQRATQLVAHLEGLSEREQSVVSMYYGEELRLREIGDILGVSESRVCQIHGEILLKLRRPMAAWK